ncbi:MAG: inositol monophosphatase [Burkholderiales bacterium]|jgi:myo-inositol-1(or 4)-monophosphatase|nr:inositol monophosphatase [Burkholderiales bacterium]
MTNPMLTIAVKAARRAGNIIMRGARDLSRLTVHAKGPKDYVSDIDQLAEEVIIDTLRESFPDHGFIAEEGTGAGLNQEAAYQWIIDPLDGTTNFLHGFPQYCVSIALAQNKQVTLGVIFDPIRNDLFTATRGGGAFMNDRRIRVSKQTHLRECLIGTGFPFREDTPIESYLNMMRALFTQTAGLRRPGAAALDLAYVAAGYYDGFFELKLHPWDIAAGSLMVQEAGGIVYDMEGGNDFLFGNKGIVAATPKIVESLLKLLTDAAGIKSNAP